MNPEKLKKIKYIYIIYIYKWFKLQNALGRKGTMIQKYSADKYFQLIYNLNISLWNEEKLLYIKTKQKCTQSYRSSILVFLIII